VTKAIKAIRLAGLDVAHVKVCRDGVFVIPGKPDLVTVDRHSNGWSDDD
jgi:hypothetical protein